MREALQQEALLWPTQVWGALLCGECSLNLGQCFRLYALCSHTHIYIYFSLSLTGSDPNILGNQLTIVIVQKKVCVKHNSCYLNEMQPCDTHGWFK